MFLTVHSAAGIIIGQSTSNIGLAFLAGFISHFLLDIIPHGDQDLGGGRNRKNLNGLKKILLILGISDLVVMTILFGSLYLSGLLILSWTILAGIFGAILPDFINATYLFFKFKWLKGYSLLHSDLHFVWWNFTINFPLGMVVQIIFLLTFLKIILNF